jgi:hypothetical protein
MDQFSGGIQDKNTWNTINLGEQREKFRVGMLLTYIRFIST